MNVRARITWFAAGFLSCLLLLAAGLLVYRSQFPRTHFRLSSDINLESVYPFKDSPPVKGALKAGTTYEVSFAEGGVDYVSFSTAILRDKVQTEVLR